MTYEPPADPPDADDREAYRAYCEWLCVPYVPGFVQRMPIWDEDGFWMPCCSLQRAAPDVPKKGGRCPACGDRFYIRTCPDGVRRVLSETAFIEVQCLWAEQEVAASCTVMTLTNSAEEAAAEERELLRIVRRRARQSVLAKFGRALPPEDFS